MGTPERTDRVVGGRRLEEGLEGALVEQAGLGAESADHAHGVRRGTPQGLGERPAPDEGRDERRGERVPRPGPVDDRTLVGEHGDAVVVPSLRARGARARVGHDDPARTEGGDGVEELRRARRRVEPGEGEGLLPIAHDQLRASVEGREARRPLLDLEGPRLEGQTHRRVGGEPLGDRVLVPVGVLADRREVQPGGHVVHALGGPVVVVGLVVDEDRALALEPQDEVHVGGPPRVSPHQGHLHVLGAQVDEDVAAQAVAAEVAGQTHAQAQARERHGDVGGVAPGLHGLAPLEGDLRAEGQDEAAPGPLADERDLVGAQRDVDVRRHVAHAQHVRRRTPALVHAHRVPTVAPRAPVPPRPLVPTRSTGRPGTPPGGPPGPGRIEPPPARGGGSMPVGLDRYGSRVKRTDARRPLGSMTTRTWMPARLRGLEVMMIVSIVPVSRATRAVKPAVLLMTRGAP